MHDGNGMLGGDGIQFRAGWVASLGQQRIAFTDDVIAKKCRLLVSAMLLQG